MPKSTNRLRWWLLRKLGGGCYGGAQVKLRAHVEGLRIPSAGVEVKANPARTIEVLSDGSVIIHAPVN
jgi:hypothetical protein